MRRTIPKPPSKRSLRAWEAFASGDLSAMPKPVERKQPKRQKEAAFDKTIGAWGKTKGGELYKNRRGMVTLPGGGMFPYGWGPNGTLDRVGWLPVRITASMVGRVLPVHCEIESKTDEGVLQDNQQQRIDYLLNNNAITGAAYGEATVEDCERAFANWLARVTG